MITTKNEQRELAENFHFQDIQVNKSNYKAILSVKRWRFIMNTPGVSQKSKEEAREALTETFFLFYVNSETLCEDGFLLEPLCN